MALGVGCLLLAAFLAWQTMSFARDGARATGEVVSYHETREGDSTRYRPRVRFRTATGEIVTIADQLSATSMRFTVGTKVPVVYKVANPTEAHIALFTDNWLGACIAALIGLAGIVGGYRVRRSIRRELEKPAA